jgi:hypothetical protein
LDVVAEEELQDVFSKAGYKDIKVDENYKRGMICGYGKKHDI